MKAERTNDGRISKQSELMSVVLVVSLLMAPLAQPSINRVRHRGVSTAAHPAPEARPAPDEQSREGQATVPVYFEENQGQMDSQVQFITRGADCSLYLTANEAVYVLAEKESTMARHAKLPESASEPVTKHALRMKFQGASESNIAGVEQLPGVINYLKGNDPSKWRRNVSTFKKVRYPDLYPGIDLVYYGQGRQLEYDFLVAPGANADRIALSFEGAARVSIDRHGDLLLTAGNQVLRHQKPHAFQEVNGIRHEVSSSYQLKENGQVGFSLGAYNHAEPLTIDPVVLAYSTYLGGDQNEKSIAIAVDNFGAVYLTGSSTSDSFPTTAGAFQTNRAGASDVFVTKLIPGNNTLVYSTFLGGGDAELGTGIAVDTDGNAYITGFTASAGATPFPTTAGAFQTTSGGGGFDGFVAKLNSTGTALVYSTYLGGGDSDEGSDITIDDAGNAYVSGDALSSVGLPFPTTPGAFQTFPRGGGDAFVAKLNTDGSALVFSTFLGGGSQDAASDITVDATGNVFVTGVTRSSGATAFPTTPGAFQTVFGGMADAFVTKLKPDGSGLLYSTYLGGAGEDFGIGIKVNAAGGTYVCGETTSSGVNPFPTTAGAFQTTNGGGSFDAFVTKLTPAGDALTYSTYLGGGDFDAAFDIAINTAGDAYVIGNTASHGATSFPTTANVFQPDSGGGYDAFVTRLNPTGTGLMYSTYLGGGDTDDGYAIALDLSGFAYVAGDTASGNPSPFPTTANAFQTSKKGVFDAFLAKVVPTFTVNVTGDGLDANPGDGLCQTSTPGNCSLRAAIQEANADPGVDTINFNIPGAGVKTISPGSELPQIVDPVIIDGYTQPGASANTLVNGDDATILIRLSGESAGSSASGLRITAGSSIVQGIAITLFQGSGIQLTSQGFNAIRGCFIGTNAAGNAVLGNSTFGVFVNSNSNTIGGFTAADRNLISGNGDNFKSDSGGIEFFQGTQNTAVGNFIGTDKSGTSSLGNSKGIRIFGGINSLVGSTNLARRNVISGNFYFGVEIIGGAATGNQVRGNFIGTDVNGTAALPNLNGVEINGANNNTIGGTTFGAGNLISGNFLGVHIFASGATANKVQGNLIGTDVSGSLAVGALGSQSVGVHIQDTDANLVGGDSAGTRNIISGNDFGVLIDHANDNEVQGNYVGTNAGGMAAIPNTTAGIAIYHNGGGNTIGAAGAARNVISGNTGSGVWLDQDSTHNIVQGNFIGTAADGSSALGNAGRGVRITTAHQNVIGGVIGQGNVIAFNQTGIEITGDPAVSNAILSNSIFSNTGLGIDLGGDSVTPNDIGDADIGPDNRQNFPVLGPAATNGPTTTVNGALDSLPNTTFTIQFFANSSCDASGNGEGQTYLGSINSATGVDGHFMFSTALIAPVPPGQFVTATATDSGNNTSEFSRCVQVTGASPTPTATPTPTPTPTPSPGLSIDDVTVNEGDSGLTNAVFTVTLSPASANTVTVNFATADLTANAGSDYISTSGLLTFNPGVTSQTITVAVDGDTLPESTEAYFVNLSSPTNSTLTRTSGIGKIANDDAQASLRFTATNYSVTEDCVSAPVTVLRTGDTSVAMDVDYITSSGSASDRSDYTFGAGTLHFAPGDTSRTFNILITEDSLVEGNETATITLLNPMGGTATLTILDDSSEPATNAIDDTSLLVGQHYHDFLNRQADSSGQAFWINNIDSCGTDASCRETRHIDTSAAFFLSIEFQQTGFLVERAYQSGFNRRVLIDEFLTDTQSLGRGVVVGATGWEQQLEANKQMFFDQLVKRPEFLSLYSSLTNAQYVDGLNADTGGSLTTAERDAMVNGLGSATETRATVLRKVTENATFSQREFNRGFVLMEYFGYLRRNPDEPGFQFWLNKLNAFKGDFRAAEMVKAFISSIEYRGRFGSP